MFTIHDRFEGFLTDQFVAYNGAEMTFSAEEFVGAMSKFFTIDDTFALFGYSVEAFVKVNPDYNPGADNGLLMWCIVKWLNEAMYQYDDVNERDIMDFFQYIVGRRIKRLPMLKP